MNDIPVEILGHIFEMWTETDDPHGPRILPFALGQICRLWRTVVWSTPTLWNHIVLRLDKQACLPHIKAARAREAISRSGSLPLFIYLATSNSMPYSLLKTDISFLFASSTRWHALDLTRLIPEDCRPFYNGLTSAPNLRILRLHSSTSATLGKINVTQIAPDLQELDSGAYCDLSVPSVPVNWHRLLSLTVDAAVDELPTVVQSANSLRRLVIVERGLQRTPNRSQHTPLIVNGNLKALHVEGTHLSRTVFDFATFSGVETITLGPGTLRTESVVAFLIRSQAPQHITSLTLCSVRWHSGSHTNILIHLPSLLELNITSLLGTQVAGPLPPDWESCCKMVFCCMQNDHSANPPSILPNLRVFRLLSSMCAVCDFVHLREAIDHVRRWQIPLSVLNLSLDIESLRLVNGQGIAFTSAMSRHVRSFRDEGRSVSITLRKKGVLHDLLAGAYFPPSDDFNIDDIHGHALLSDIIDIDA